MFDRPIWCHCIGENTASFQAALDSLQNAGLKFTEFVSSAFNSDGIVLFDEPKEALFQFLRGASYNGLVRIFAIALSASFNAKSALKILAAGAADVSTWTDARAKFVEELRSRLERWQTIDEAVDSAIVQENLIGSSPA